MVEGEEKEMVVVVMVEGEEDGFDGDGGGGGARGRGGESINNMISPKPMICVCGARVFLMKKMLDGAPVH
jgi:hypothetical protein